jgi:hypothetical protein
MPADPASARQPLAPLFDRRDLLKVGGLTIAATAVPATLTAAINSGEPANAKAKSVVVLWMAGGVTHIDSFDPKPDAPVEVRGTLQTIRTRLPGVHFCETLPRLAQVADQLAILRSYSHDSDDHLLSQAFTLSGRKVTQQQLFSEPNIGSLAEVAPA